MNLFRWKLYQISNIHGVVTAFYSVFSARFLPKIPRKVFKPKKKEKGEFEIMNSFYGKATIVGVVKSGEIRQVGDMCMMRRYVEIQGNTDGTRNDPDDCRVKWNRRKILRRSQWWTQIKYCAEKKKRWNVVVVTMDP